MFPDSVVVVLLPQCKRINPEEYGKIYRMDTYGHSRARYKNIACRIHGVCWTWIQQTHFIKLFWRQPLVLFVSVTLCLTLGNKNDPSFESNPLPFRIPKLGNRCPADAIPHSVDMSSAGIVLTKRLDIFSRFRITFIDQGPSQYRHRLPQVWGFPC